MRPYRPGLLVLPQTRRLELFRLDARQLMRQHLDQLAGRTGA
jgi:hypothetical protein